MKIAVVLIVKDEVDDILPWLGWYAHLGVDSLIVYDDGSTDGTSQLVEDAGRLFDVRLIRVLPTAETFTARQARSYIEALNIYKDEFDWIGFFDADEYLAVDHGTNLKDVLATVAGMGAGAMAVHWRNYGTNGHVLTPHGLPFAAYTWHSSPEEPINWHVKSFVRPRLWAGSWVNVHYFAVEPMQYLYANGETPIWSETKGITQPPPSWDHIRVMHYQCRSLEQYVNRIRKRPDIPPDAAPWYESNYSYSEDTSPRSAIVPVSRWIAAVAMVSAQRVLNSEHFMKSKSPFGNSRMGVSA